MVKCQIPNYGNLKPGTLLKPGGYCHGNKTEGGYCVGNKAGEPCTNHIDCDVNLFCYDGKCKEAAKENETCNKGLYCVSYLKCYKEICVPYGSLKIGESVAMNTRADICETRFYDKNLICKKGKKLISPPCTMLENDCKYEYEGKIEVYHGSCSYSKNGSYICTNGTDDLINEWHDLLDYMKQRPNCHVEDQYGFCDKGREVGCKYYIPGLKGYYKIKHNSFLINTPECLNNWQLKEYWNPNCTDPILTY